MGEVKERAFGETVGSLHNQGPVCRRSAPLVKGQAFTVALPWVCAGKRVYKGLQVLEKGAQYCRCLRYKGSVAAVAEQQLLSNCFLNSHATFTYSSMLARMAIKCRVCLKLKVFRVVGLLLACTSLPFHPLAVKRLG
eukprot:1140949-Pelagomonas_calceolata.AAC.1